MKEELKHLPLNWDDWLRTTKPYLNLAAIVDITRVPVHCLNPDDFEYPQPPPLPEGLILTSDDEDTISYSSSDEEDDTILGMY